MVVNEWRLETVFKVSGALRERSTYLAAMVLRLKRQILRRPLLRTISLLLILRQWRLIVEVDALGVLLRSIGVAHVAPILLGFLLI